MITRTVITTHKIAAIIAYGALLGIPMDEEAATSALANRVDFKVGFRGGSHPMVFIIDNNRGQLTRWYDCVTGELLPFA